MEVDKVDFCKVVLDSLIISEKKVFFFHISFKKLNENYTV